MSMMRIDSTMFDRVDIYVMGGSTQARVALVLSVVPSSVVYALVCEVLGGGRVWHAYANFKFIRFGSSVPSSIVDV